MKNIICVFIALFCLTNSFSQDQLKDYPGIPIITYRGCVISNSVGGPYLTVDDFKYADSSGIFAMQLDNVNANEFNTYIAPTNLRVMPAEIDKTLTDYILTYTEGRYTEFEAEGTPWEDGVTLYSDSLDLYFGNGAVSTKPTTEHGTMIYGPMYRQCRNYLAVTPGPIPYTASYIIKIDDVDPWLDSSPEDTVCILQVTSSRTWDTCGYMIGTDWVQSQFYTGFEETLVHADTVITYGDLQPSIWDTVHLNYIFDHNVPWFGPASNPYQVVSRYGSNNENMLDEHISQNCVEFKVIWKGKADRVKLSIDKIIVSDLRGRNLKNTNQFQDIKENIEQQIRDLLAFTSVEDESRTVGFIGVDEPWSLDQWEPIRIVNEIVDSYRPNNKRFELYYQFNVQAFGRFSWPEDPALGSHVIMIDEFMKRVGKANVWITGWLYDVPCDGFTPDPPCADFILPRPICNEARDFRVVNIDHLADSIYKRVVQASEKYPGLFYGMSTQTGRYHAPVREINGREMLYTNNLALLYGSKLLSPWLYFTWDYPWVPGSYTGISNLVAPSTHEITDKYWMLRDTIAPRLNGLMGRTLKKLKPLDQYAGSRGINYTGTVPWSMVAGGYEYIEDIIPQVLSTDEYGLDLGFFVDSLYTDKNYFMVLNRYYSTSSKYYIKLRNLDGFINWNLKNYVDTTSLTLLAEDNKAEFLDTLYRGDANLYSIAPVAKHGGSLIADETVGEGTTLYDDMVIKNSAILAVTGDYFAKGNIIIENGRIENLDGGRIIFQDGKRLIVNGIATINGTSEEKLILPPYSS